MTTKLTLTKFSCINCGTELDGQPESKYCSNTKCPRDGLVTMTSKEKEIEVFY